MTVTEILIFLTAVQVKHMLADFWWQSSWMVANKGRYGHPAGLSHAGLHAVLTLAILLGLAVFAPLLSVLVAATELVLHYHIDWMKERLLQNGPSDITDSGFWRGIGLDQLAHQLTYVALLGLALIV